MGGKASQRRAVNGTLYSRDPPPFSIRARERDSINKKVLEIPLDGGDHITAYHHPAVWVASG